LYYANGSSETDDRDQLRHIFSVLSGTEAARDKKVEEIQEQIDRGEYLTDEKLNFAIYRMLKEILKDE
jgi:anti-sigma28 factor (negative regulator of flagellin synthesis)